MGLTDKGLAYLPYAYPQFEAIRETHENQHWITGEIDWSQDVLNWVTVMTEDERTVVRRVISLFTQSDYQVGSMYLDNLIPRIQNNEARGMLTSFACREFEHQKMYSHVGTTLGFKDSYWTEFLEEKATRDKDDIMRELVHPDVNFGLAVTKNILSEGVSLFGMFGILRSLEVRGLMMGMSTGNAWSMADEQTHTDGLIELFKVWAAENPKEIDDAFKRNIYSMARKFVESEMEFIDYALKGITLEGLNKEDLKLYIMYLCDRRLIEMGLKGNFNITQDPMPWLSDLVSAEATTNFFEQRPTEYSVNGMTGVYAYV